MVTTNTSADLAYGKSAWGWQALLVAFVAATWTAGLYDAFGAAYTIQDDARHFVAFMARWLEPTAFAGDPMADYFLGAAPLAYRSIHWVAAQAGLDPLFTNRLLPPLLGGWTAYAAFRLGSALGGSARAGVLVALFTTLIVGATDTLAAGTPRGLAVPLLLSFLAACVSKRTLAIAATMVLLALSYPQAALLAAGTLALQIVDVSDGIRISRDRGRWWQTAICIFVTVLALAPFALRMDGFGPAITAEEARRLPLMQAGGSVPYFADSWWQTILCGKRAGLLVMGPACQAVQSLGSWAVALVALVGAAFTFGLPILLWRRPKAPGSGVVWLRRSSSSRRPMCCSSPCICPADTASCRASWWSRSPSAWPSTVGLRRRSRSGGPRFQPLALPWRWPWSRCRSCRRRSLCSTTSRDTLAGSTRSCAARKRGQAPSPPCPRRPA
jgi:hypothetical protein